MSIKITYAAVQVVDTSNRALVAWAQLEGFRKRQRTAVAPPPTFVRNNVQPLLTRNNTQGDIERSNQ